MIDECGGPPVELARESWLSLSERVAEDSMQIPPPPSFPRIAIQILALARDPDVHLNELIGLVQRDGAIASTLVRIANSPAFAPAVPITTLRAAIQSLGLRAVVELVVGSSGRAYYNVASTIELGLFPAMWRTMFNDAIANALSAGRLALDMSNSSGESALFAGLLTEVGRPIALRILATLIRNGAESPGDEIALAVVEEVAPRIGERAILAMDLPAELRAACIFDPCHPRPDAQIARLVSSIGAIQRRSPRSLARAADARALAEQLRLGPYVLRSLFSQRSQYVEQAAELFSGR